jgi:hypothetical protein
VAAVGGAQAGDAGGGAVGVERVALGDGGVVVDEAEGGEALVLDQLERGAFWVSEDRLGRLAST